MVSVEGPHPAWRMSHSEAGRCFSTGGPRIGPSGVSGINAGAAVIFATVRACRLGDRVPQGAPDSQGARAGSGLADGPEDKR